MFFEVPMLGRSNARQPQQIARTQAEEGHTFEAAEQRFGADVLAILEQHYPTHFWKVGVDFAQGIATVSIPILMGPTARYVLHLTRIANLPDMRKAVIEAGGHILERFRIPRGSLDLGLGQFLEARATKRLTTPHQAMPN